MTMRTVLMQAAERALSYRDRVDQVSPYPNASATDLREYFDVGLPEKGRAGIDVIAQLADAAEPGLVGSTGNSFFGWVMGASNPVGIAADWLTAAWGQNSAIYQTAPSAAIAEEIAGKWLIDLLDLPRQSSIGFTTGATMASFICLAAARSEVLKRHGWDVEARGLYGAPEIRVYLSEEAHSTIFAGLRFLGFGNDRLVRINADQEGRMDTDDLARKLGNQSGPTLIISQAGHINTGAFDDFNAVNGLAEKYRAWHHVDGAFGLWARSSPDLAHLCDGAEKADSWSVDGHKWLQVPYDSGYAIVKHSDAHRRAMATTAGYLNETAEDGRNPTHFVPELSRRARGFATWAVLQHLGRRGVSDIVEGNSQNAAQLAAYLAQVPGIRILHNVVLNQVCLEFTGKNGLANSLTGRVAEQLQESRIWFVKEAEWRGKTVLRISFSSATKSKSQIDAFADAIIECWETVQSELQEEDHGAEYPALMKSLRC